MFVNRYLRQFVGLFLGGAAALSLSSMILPSAMAATGQTDAFWARLLISEYTAHAVLLWAASGWWISRSGRMSTGGILLGAVGLLTGVLAGLLVNDPQPLLLVICGCCGGFYGMTVGLLLGRLLEAPPTEQA